jgi:hypothetical protein
MVAIRLVDGLIDDKAISTTSDRGDGDSWKSPVIHQTSSNEKPDPEQAPGRVIEVSNGGLSPLAGTELAQLTRYLAKISPGSLGGPPATSNLNLLPP